MIDTTRQDPHHGEQWVADQASVVLGVAVLGLCVRPSLRAQLLYCKAYTPTYAGHRTVFRGRENEGDFTVKEISFEFNYRLPLDYLLLWSGSINPSLQSQTGFSQPTFFPN